MALTAAGCASQIAKPDALQFPPPPQNAITFWGHACCYIDVGGYGIVTDPVFDTWTLMRTRKMPAPPPANFGATRVILLSHAHDDHLSAKSIALFPESTLVLCPYPAVEHAAKAQRPVRGMSPGDTFEFPGGRIVAVAAHHPGSRRGVDAEADGRALGWVVELRQRTLYYSGDTDPFPGFAEVRRRHRPDVLILNINGHLHGPDAVAAADSSGAAIVIPAHHGVYGLSLWGPRRQPRDVEVLQRDLGSRLRILPLGGSLRLDAR